MIKIIREFLQKNNWDAFLCPHTDEFLSEYVTRDRNRLKKLTGFTGSAGLCLVTPTDFILWTDSRYTVQAAEQTSARVLDVSKINPIDEMGRLLKGKKLVVPSSCTRASLVLKLLEKGIDVIPQYIHPVDLFWSQRPKRIIERCIGVVFEYTGAKTAEKIQRVIPALKDVDAFLVSDSLEVSWLLNQRCYANPQYPVSKKRVLLFADGRYTILPRKRIQNLKIGLDTNTVPYDLLLRLGEENELVKMNSPIPALQAVKNPVEIENIQKTCLFESAVICRFLAWAYQHANRATELSCGQKLKQLRSVSPFYLGESFDPIVATGSHAVSAHYQATKSTNVRINSAPMTLVDTGGQYMTATTDMTRTFAAGKEVSPLMKKRYTQVLKGHIALAMTPVQLGDLPRLLDTNARQFLRADGVDYGHATGHGIGTSLSVHEPVPCIYEKSETPLVAGMLFSNEPGFYDEQNGFGIRLENMILTRADGNRLILENLLFIPFDKNCVDETLLTPAEKQWLKEYHLQIVRRIYPMLDGKTMETLQPHIDFFVSLC